MLSLLSIGATAHAQYASPETAAVQQRLATENKAQAARDAMVGTRFWITPNQDGERVIFRYSSPVTKGITEKFVVTEPTSFVVVGFLKDYTKFVEVEFPDGRRAYLYQGIFDDAPQKQYLFSDPVYIPGINDKPDREFISALPPEEMLAAEKKLQAKRSAAAAAWKARGGVRIGMTAQQVLASNWGKPKRVNRTTGAYGVHEQWIYGGTNYLYFENGTLTAIQN